MKNYLIALLAVVAFGLASCGGNDEKAADNQNEAVEQQTEQTQNQENQEAAPAKEENKQEAGNEQAAASGKDGKTLFVDNNCAACHQPDKKTVGPALKEIAAKYNGDKAKLVNFLKGNGEAIVDPANFSTMKPNLEITKKLSDDDLNAIADYILSNK